MADRLTADELDKMQKSVIDMTDLSRNLRAEFTKIKNTTDLLSQNFKDIIKSAENNTNIAERYLIAQKTSNVLSERINALKSKSGYLDSIGLQFKQQELVLQKQITTAQISRLLKSNALDAVAKKEAIDALKLKMILADTELDYLDKNNKLNNSVVTSLNEQLVISDNILDNIQLIRDGVVDTNSATGELKGSFNFLFGKTGLIVKDLGNLGKLIEGSAGSAAFLAEILKVGYENFKLFDKAAASVRSNLGALPGQANNLESLIKEVGIESMHLGATFDDVAKSINEIANEFTGLVAQDKDLLKTTTALSKQFGISESISAKFLKTLGGISGSSASSQRSMVGFAQKISQAAGVPLGKIMHDVADASDDVRIYVGSSVVSIIKAAAAARMLGIDLNKAALTADKLLNFESSIASELKASALLGQNINFNYARQLFFNKNIIAANKEILRLTKQVNFNQLDPIKQKAYADAAGKSVGELQDMLQQEKNLALVANSTNKDVRKRYEEYMRLMQVKEEDAKNEGKLAEQEFLRRANQEKLAQIQNKFNQLMSELAEPVMEVTEYLLDIAIVIMPHVITGIKMGITLFKSLSAGAGYIATKLGAWITATSAIIGPLTRTSKILLNIGKFLLPIISTFGRWLNPIGWVITALMGIKSLMGGIAKYWDESADWPSKMWTGLKLLTKAIIEAFLPFDTVRKNLDEWFFGKSPSKAGKLIAKGFSSIGPELQDSLVTPVNKAYDEIKNISPPEIKVTGGFSSIGSKLQDSLITSVNKAYGEIKNISPPEINVDSATTNKLIETTDNTLISVIKTSNQQLVAKIDQLMTMMANGGIAVNLDGQRINAALSTTILKSGGFGQSTTRA